MMPSLPAVFESTEAKLVLKQDFFASFYPFLPQADLFRLRSITIFLSSLRLASLPEGTYAVVLYSHAFRERELTECEAIVSGRQLSL